jgi:hypothetical protein
MIFSWTPKPTSTPHSYYDYIDKLEMGIAWWVLKSIVTYFILRDVAIHVLPFVVSKLVSAVVWVFGRTLALVIPKSLAEKAEEELETMVGEGLDDVEEHVSAVAKAVASATKEELDSDKEE